MLKIRIKENAYGNLAAFSDYSLLFEFRNHKDENEWLFWPPGCSNNNPLIITEKEFPKQFFFELCRSVMFIQFQTPLKDTESIRITHGLFHVKQPNHQPIL